MSTGTQQTNSRRWVLPFLAALVAALAAILGISTASAQAAGVAENRVGAIDFVGEVLVGPPQHVSAGQSRDAAENRPGIVVATGVAAKTADDWPILSGIVRDAAKGKGNFGLGSGTASQAERAGQSWVGDGFSVASDGKTLISRDGLRQWRPPSYKPNLDKWQSNFESRLVPRGQWQGNGHLDITDLP